MRRGQFMRLRMFFLSPRALAATEAHDRLAAFSFSTVLRHSVARAHALNEREKIKDFALMVLATKYVAAYVSNYACARV